MTKIAISYRREDTGPVCGRLYDRLRAHYGPDNVFIDIDAIPIGTDFRDHLRTTFAAVDALIVVIGPRWLGKRKSGARIFDEGDWVRIEVEIAFQCAKRVYPVLIGDTVMPNADQLPQSIREIAFAQAGRIDPVLDFHAHVNKLIRAIDSDQAAGKSGGTTANPLRRMFHAVAARWARAGVPTMLRSGVADRAAAGTLAAAPEGGRSGFPDRWRAKPLRYWLSAILVLLASMLATPYIEDHFDLAPARGFLYRILAELQPRAIEPRDTRVVFISDEDFWKGSPAGRTPINRAYIADIVDRVSAAGAAVIALDFNMHLPNPNAQGVLTDIPAEYRNETDRLVHAIERAAGAGQKIVLPRTMIDGDRTAYQLAPDIFQPYGICTGFDARKRWLNPGIPAFEIKPEAALNISCGYIALPKDMAALPMPLKMVGNGALDSFSIAIVRAFNPGTAESLGNGQYFGSYIPESTLAATPSAITAGNLFDPHFDAKRLLQYRAVIIGGHWQKGRYGSGDVVDMIKTPMGMLSGVVVHQNFVEAVLDGRRYPKIPNWALCAISLVFGVLAMLLFAARQSLLGKLATLLGLLAILALIQWVMMQTLGVFFDAFIMLLALWLHAAYVGREGRPTLSGSVSS